MNIKITCSGSRFVPLESLKDFQGALKTISRDELNKVKRSILKIGFSFPVFVWNEEIIDGHQRVKAVNELLREGHEIDDIPVVDIYAENRSEAAEKLLRLNSQHGKITDDGLLAFVDDNGVNVDGLLDDLSLPDVDVCDLFQKEESGPGGDGDGECVDGIDKDFGIHIDCETEGHRAKLLEKFKKDGLRCRAI